MTTVQNILLWTQEVDLKGKTSEADLSETDPLRDLLLFLTLLQERQREREREKAPIGLLCTIPVWKWVYGGQK